MTNIKAGTRYRHYRNHKTYCVVDVALYTETDEKMVVYRAEYDCPDLTDEYGDHPLFVRPYNNFIDILTINGVETPRFIEINDA